jgi:hypothetical protein
MAKTESTLSRHDLEAKIVKRCWEDAAFRKEFTADPAGAFVKYLKVPAGQMPKIVVYEETAGSWHIVLPPKPPNANELSEADLEKVAGGAISQAVSAISRVAAPALSGGAVSGATVASGIVTVEFASQIGAGVSGVVDAVKGW